ncbi:zinc finger CCCH domain-containing protein 19-like [Iris pallida]|uniref:Zinc finger CCCH domain-containing protein 19-like n=1 Tax=Iris pallida TaxID=29817 RepID=A0AAX6GYJ2_IRIPA|nr:zinc finger CCCH domain-containing protein 19-like [Iris pallida]
MGEKTYEFSGDRGNRSNQMDCAKISNPEGSASIQNNNHSVMKPFESSTVPPETMLGSLSANAAPLSTPSETEKMWNYQDPSGKIQGPFSMTQLRKWNTNGFFPANLRIWRTSEKQEDSILLTDSLNGKFHNDLAREEPQHNNSQPTNGAAVMNYRVNNLDGGCGGNINQQPPAGVPAMSNNSLTKANRWTTQPSSSPMANTGVVNPVDGRSAVSSSDWEASKEGNAWRGQQQGNDSHRTSFPRNSSHYPSYQGRDDRGNIGRWNGGRGRQNNWNSNRQRRFQPNDRGFDGQHSYQSSSGQQFSGEQWKSQPARQQSSGEQWKNQPARQKLSGEQWKNQPDNGSNGSSNQLGNSFVNLPAPTPPQSGIDWTSLQGALNKILPPASSAHLMTSGQVQQSPVQTNVSNILSPTLYSVGGWPSGSGTTDSSILVQENVHFRVIHRHPISRTRLRKVVHQIF